LHKTIADRVAGFAFDGSIPKPSFSEVGEGAGISLSRWSSVVGIFVGDAALVGELLEIDVTPDAPFNGIDVQCCDVDIADWNPLRQ
jgi:hypothetical protein